MGDDAKLSPLGFVMDVQNLLNSNSYADRTAECDGQFINKVRLAPEQCAIVSDMFITIALRFCRC